MSPRSGRPTPVDRRTVLRTMGVATASGAFTSLAAGAPASPEYHVKQGDECIPITPLSGDETVESFYDFRLPPEYAGSAGALHPGYGPYYRSVGTEALQRPDTSILFLYDGPKGLSLVIVHEGVGSVDGGSATWVFTGLPADGQWVVEDDYYHDPGTPNPASTNYDNWDTGNDPVTIDWTWAAGRTDGGAFRALGDDFSIHIVPKFNQSAALYDEYYQGQVRDWQVLSGSLDDPTRHSLRLDHPIWLASGSCESPPRARPAATTPADEHARKNGTNGHESEKGKSEDGKAKGNESKRGEAKRHEADAGRTTDGGSKHDQGHEPSKTTNEGKQVGEEGHGNGPQTKAQPGNGGRAEGVNDGSKRGRAPGKGSHGEGKHGKRDKKGKKRDKKGKKGD